MSCLMHTQNQQTIQKIEFLKHTKCKKFEFPALFWSKRAGKLTRKHKTKKVREIQITQILSKSAGNYKLTDKQKSAGNSNYSNFDG